MKSKLPADAFGVYASLGPARSYARVAAHFRCNRATIVRAAGREKWQERLAAAEKEARERVHSTLVMTLAEMQERHLRVLRHILAKGLDALKALPISTTRDALRAVDLSLKNERALIGAGSEIEGDHVVTIQ